MSSFFEMGFLSICAETVTITRTRRLPRWGRKGRLWYWTTYRLP